MNDHHTPTNCTDAVGPRERREFRPSAAKVRGVAVEILLSSVSLGVGFLCLGGLLWVRVNEGGSLLLCGALFFLLFGSLFLASDVRVWRLRATPLVVENSGRISYRGQELCPAGTARGVVIVRRDPEEMAPPCFDNCALGVQLAHGKIINLPSPYFSPLNEDESDDFVRDLARALGVRIVVDPAEPVAAPDPTA